MIPIESDRSIPSLIIGHNVAFDRTYIKEQYQLEVKKMIIYNQTNFS
jgi:DNA polymerase III epsilon subunit-like protein